MSTKQAGTLGVAAAAEGTSASAMGGILMGQLNSDGGERVFERVVVEEVIFDPAMLDDKRLDSLIKQYGLQNDHFLKTSPPNTIIGKRVIGSSSGTESGSQYFFPFFSSHLMMPVKAGEHVWVFYEPGKAKDYGFWITRIHEPRSIEDTNHTHADRKHHVASTVSTIDKFEGKTTKIPSFANGALVEKGSEIKSIATTASSDGDVDVYEKMIKKSDAGKISDMEDVPRYKKRPGDFAFQGSNNTLIVLGTDRTGSPAESEDDVDRGKVAKQKPKADQVGKSGSIDIVVGRGQNPKTAPETVKNSIGNTETKKDVTNENADEGNPDLEFDLGRIYISMKSDADENFNVQLKGISKDPAGPYAVIKVDHVRIIARKSIKYLLQPTKDTPESDCAGIVIKDGNIIFLPSDSGVVKLGGEDASMAILCQPAGINAGGTVSGPPIVSTIGSTVGTAGANGQYATKVVAK